MFRSHIHFLFTLFSSEIRATSRPLTPIQSSYMTQTSAATTRHPTIMQTSTMTALFFANSHRPTWIPFCARIDFHNRPASDAEKLQTSSKKDTVGKSQMSTRIHCGSQGEPSKLTYN
jgi:hypothetical protein